MTWAESWSQAILRGACFRSIITGMSSTLTAGLLSAVCVFGLSGCGGGGGEICANAPGCGGDVVGTWRITSACLSVMLSFSSPSCPTQTASGSAVGAEGTVTYNSGLTYTSNTAFTGTITSIVPPECLVVNGSPVTCDWLDQQNQAHPTAGVTVRCSGSPCTCTETFTPTLKTQMGTYTTSARVLTETPAGGTGDQSDYCVVGTTMTVSPHITSMMNADAGVSGTEMGTITLTKI